MRQCSLFVIIFIWLLCTTNTCNNKENCHKIINFVNGSSKDVYIHSCHYCWDTLEFDIPGLKSFNASQLRVKPNEKNTSGLWSVDCYEAAITQGRVIVYIIDAEILETTPRDTIVKYRMALKTIYPSVEEMRNSNWTITYTGE